MRDLETSGLRMKNINPWFFAARPRTFPAGIAPVILGSALASHVGSFQLVPAILCLAFSLLVQIGCNYANDYYDYVKGVDTKERVGFARMVSTGMIAPKAMKKAAFFVLALAFIVGLGLIYYGGWWMLVVGVVSIVTAVAYTGGPYPIGYHGLGDLFVFIFYGLVAVVFTFYVQTGYFLPEVFWVAAGCGLLATNIRLVNDVRDRETDANAGKKTLVVRFGKRFCCMQYLVSFIIAIVVVPVVLVLKFNFTPWTYLSIVLIFWGTKLGLELCQAKSGSVYNKLLEKTAKLLFAYSVLLGIIIGS